MTLTMPIAARSRLHVLVVVLSAFAGCSSRSANDAPAPSPEVDDCEAFLSAMDRCVGGVTGGAETVSALRASLTAAPNASEADLLARKQRCATSRSQLARACK